MDLKQAIMTMCAAFGRLRVNMKVFGAVLALGLAASGAQAVPSYARQTGAECAACHVGGYGPQLTPYGIKFKLGGYTDSDGKGTKVPLSAMLVANMTRTSKDASDGDTLEHFRSNNNAAMQEASVFLAGRLSDNIGTFTQVTYSGIERKSGLDQFDLRYAREVNWGGVESTIGLSLNTNPTATDPFNTMGQWRFPYTSSDFNAGFGPAPLVEDGLGGSVFGANAYAFIDKNIYAEFGLYDTMSRRSLSRLNTDDAGRFKNLAKYWRVAYFKDMKRDNFSVGLFGFNADLQPDRVGGPADGYRDLGIDASYQFLGNREHIYTLTTSYVKEWQSLKYTQGVAGAADNRHNNFDQFRIAGSYHYNQSWGVTAGLFDVRGKRDATLNGDSLNGRPNTSGYLLQADWTPWGKEDSWGAPWANIRLGLQYTGYHRYMGSSHYLDADGNIRRASDNNTTMLFLWTSL